MHPVFKMSRIASLENEKAILNLKKDKFLDNYFAVKRELIFKKKLMQVYLLMVLQIFLKILKMN